MPTAAPPTRLTTQAQRAVYDAALDAALDHRLELHRRRRAGDLDVKPYLSGLAAVRKVEELLEPLRGGPSRAYELSVAERAPR